MLYIQKGVQFKINAEILFKILLVRQIRCSFKRVFMLFILLRFKTNIKTTYNERTPYTSVVS